MQQKGCLVHLNRTYCFRKKCVYEVKANAIDHTWKLLRKFQTRNVKMVGVTDAVWSLLVKLHYNRNFLTRPQSNIKYWFVSLLGLLEACGMKKGIVSSCQAPIQLCDFVNIIRIFVCRLSSSSAL